MTIVELLRDFYKTISKQPQDYFGNFTSPTTAIISNRVSLLYSNQQMPVSSINFGSFMFCSIQDPKEPCDFIRNHTGPGMTLWTIHKQPKKTIQDVARTNRTKEDNTVRQQYNP